MCPNLYTATTQVCELVSLRKRENVLHLSSHVTISQMTDHKPNLSEGYDQPCYHNTNKVNIHTTREKWLGHGPTVAVFQHAYSSWRLLTALCHGEAHFFTLWSVAKTLASALESVFIHNLGQDSFHREHTNSPYSE